MFVGIQQYTKLINYLNNASIFQLNITEKWIIVLRVSWSYSVDISHISPNGVNHQCSNIHIHILILN